MEILHQLQGIRAVLDRVVQTQKDTGTSSTHDSTPRLATGLNLSSSNLNHDNPGNEHRGNLPDRIGYSPLNSLRVGSESLLFWPKVREFLGEPVAERSFVLECTLDTARGPAPEGQSSQYGIREDDFTILCRDFLDHVHVRNPILEPSDLENYAKQLAETGMKWDTKTCLVVCDPSITSLIF